MQHDIITVRGDETPAQILDRLDHDSQNLRRSYPVVDADNRLQGIVMHHLLEEKRGSELVARDLIGEQKVETVTPDTSIRDAAMHMVKTDIRQLPVVSRKDRGKMLGILTLNDIARQQNAMIGQVGR